jgi:hypothetical protein
MKRGRGAAKGRGGGGERKRAKGKKKRWESERGMWRGTWTHAYVVIRSN